MCLTLEDKLVATVNRYEKILSNMRTEHSIRLYEREKELEKIIAAHDQDWKQRLRRIQVKYDTKLAELMEKVNSLSCQTRELIPDESTYQSDTKYACDNNVNLLLNFT